MWVKYDVIGGRGRVVGSGEGGASEVTHLSRHDNHEGRRRGNHHKVSVYTYIQHVRTLYMYIQCISYVLYYVCVKLANGRAQT